MLSIGSFARLVGVSVRMLRHYDRLGLLAPDHVDPCTGYRYYSSSQLAQANQLVAMKELGFSLEQVGELLADDVRAARLVQLLCERRQQLTDQIRADQQRLAQVEARLRLIQEEPVMSQRAYAVTALPELRLAGLTTTISEMERIGPAVGPLFQKVDDAVTSSGAERIGPSVGHYTDRGDSMLVGAGDQLADGAVPPGLEATTLPAVERALVTTYAEEDLEGLPRAWQELVEEVERRGEKLSGPCREVYVGAPFTGAGGWVVELQQPLA